MNRRSLLAAGLTAAPPSVAASAEAAGSRSGKEANWLPAPAGPFQMAMRLYWPKPAALDGAWTAPPLAVAR